MKLKSIRNIFGSLVCLAILAIAGCGKTGASFSSTATTYIAFMNMAPYQPAADIYLNGVLSSGVGGIPAGNYSSSYGGLKPGNYDIMFKKAGADSLMAEVTNTLYDTSFFSTVILYDSSGGIGPARAVRLIDDFSTVSNYNANYRFLDLAPDAPKVDLYLNATLIQPARTNADIFVNSAYNVFQQIPATGYTIKASVSGFSPDSVLASLPLTNLVVSGVYSIILSENKSSSGNSYALSILQASY